MKMSAVSRCFGRRTAIPSGWDATDTTNIDGEGFDSCDHKRIPETSLKQFLTRSNRRL